MLDTIKQNKVGAVIGGVIGAYTVAELAIKKLEIKNPKGVIAMAVVSTVIGVIVGARIQKMISGKRSTGNTVKNPTAKQINDAKNDPMFNPKG